LSNKVSPMSASQPSRRKAKLKPSWPAAYITYGVHDFGHASRVGKYVLDDDPISEIVLDEISINGKFYKLFCAQDGNHELTLTPGKDYRWLCVAGESMNSANPTAIEPGDYVLTDINRNANVGDIVVANLLDPPTPAEHAGVIKRFAGNELRSESDKKIEPIPIAEAKLSGVVIAIAKSVDQQLPNLPAKAAQSQEPWPEPVSDEVLLDELLALARGDQELAERLIEHELGREPKISRKDAIERSILHWRRQL